MPVARITPDLEMFYRDDCFADAWREVPTLLLLHGNAESSEAWNAWMPLVARHFRVVRPDMRGFGQSTPMPLDYPWSPECIIDDFLALSDTLGLGAVHIAAAKVACPIALRLAARHPERVRSLVVLGGIVSGEVSLGDRAASWLEHIKMHGVESWARWTMPGRLGSACPPAMQEGWSKLMGRTALSTQLGFIRSVPGIDVRADLPTIKCPTLVVTTDGSGLGSIEAVRGWQKTIPGSELMVVAGDSYHVAATHPELCANATLDFIARRTAVAS
jgi:pimeloyl-ACP methyl ester carboxylesterase